MNGTFLPRTTNLYSRKSRPQRTRRRHKLHRPNHGKHSHANHRRHAVSRAAVVADLKSRWRQLAFCVVMCTRSDFGRLSASR